jgi:hypothetical protein
LVAFDPRRVAIELIPSRLRAEEENLEPFPNVHMTPGGGAGKLSQGFLEAAA